MKAKEIVRKWRSSFACTLLESIMSSEVELAMTNWIKNTNTDEYVLIGGLVVGYYTKPRMTQDIDVLYKDSTLIPVSVHDFNHHRKHTFEHIQTGVEIETLEPKFINISDKLVDQIFKTSVIKDNVRIPSATGMVALKVCIHSNQDIADIDAISAIHDINLADWDVREQNVEFVEQRIQRKLRK